MAAKKRERASCRHVRRILVALQDRHDAVDPVIRRIA
jgi:hypothetical protein